MTDLPETQWALRRTDNVVEIMASEAAARREAARERATVLCRGLGASWRTASQPPTAA
ncbi:MAG TPA: hypothetical protein VMU51_33275 [Mycobacteriales bacterium]|nr:hypothetical protein [Mycobacteriales bacterium]